VREQEQLLRGVKAHKIADRPARAQQAAQPPVCEHPLDEVVAQPRVGQSTFLLDGQVGEGLDERCGEQTATATDGTSAAVVDLYPLQAAAR
jgi:hypothetical protein